MGMEKYCFILLIALIGGYGVIAQDSIVLRGTVIASITGEPIEGCTVTLQETKEVAVTNGQGTFHLKTIVSKGILSVSRVSYEGTAIAFEGTAPLLVRLEPKDESLEEVTVHTGYQQLSKERVTGSFVKLNKELLNRSVSTDIISRLEGITPGLLFNRALPATSGRSPITIRGASTIYAEDQPLVILDNFPFEGDPGTINPADVESITILKDAAAASIWGARSANGVIVITTKQGKLATKPLVSFNAKVNITEKPNLFYQPQISPKGFIEMERFLFDKGYYDNTLNSDSHFALSPVIQTLHAQRQGWISATEAENQIAAMQGHNVRNDLQRYLYQPSFSQGYAGSISGGGAHHTYYISGGYDHNRLSLVENSYERFTVTARNSFSFLKNKLRLTSGMSWTQTNLHAPNEGTNVIAFSNSGLLYPYAQLADESGQALAIQRLSSSYTDTAGGGLLLDWKYRPLEELQQREQKTQNAQYLLSLGLNYQPLRGWDILVEGRFGKEFTQSSDLHKIGSYYTRNYVNSFSQVDAFSNSVYYPVPKGDIFDLNTGTSLSRHLRLQSNYHTSFGEQHQLSTLLGAEVSAYSTRGGAQRMYGYNEEYGSDLDVDYVNNYPLYYAPDYRKIERRSGISSSYDRFVSYFANAAYTYQSRYTVSVSARKDASNLFGVATNQKWVPLWSAGFKWDVSGEGFYKVGSIPHLSLRGSYGYNGNIDKSVTAFLTAVTINNNTYGVPYVTITNPPNPDLRWERVRTWNIGIDFSTAGKRFSGTIEYYLKKGIDLMGDAPLAPSSGLIQYRGNTANIKGRGIDVTLNVTPIQGPLTWNQSLLFSFARTVVSDYKIKPTKVIDYMSRGTLDPVEGKDLVAVYSFKYAGLDGHGDPQGYLDNKISTDYTAMLNSKDFGGMVFNGPVNPWFFGTLRSNFSWKNLSLSFSFLYKLHYYFKRASVDYSSLFSGNSLQSPDFDKRWQKGGDEFITSVPAMVYPSVDVRDLFYSNADILVEKGDHIRLHDVRLSYELGSFTKRFARSAQLYFYAQNLGILWRANDAGIDPDASSGLPYPKAFSVGFQIDFK
jgi:TonB-linked SusC/RagA family outer membrane protein